MTSTAVSTTTTRPNAPAIAARATVGVEMPDGAAVAWSLAAPACSAGSTAVTARVDHAVPGPRAGPAVRRGLDPGHYLGRVQPRVSGPDQRDHPGHEGGGEAGPVLRRVVGGGEGARVGAGDVHPGCRDPDRGVPVGEAGQDPAGPDRADRQYARVGGGVERAGPVVR